VPAELLLKCLGGGPFGRGPRGHADSPSPRRLKHSGRAWKPRTRWSRFTGASKAGRPRCITGGTANRSSAGWPGLCSTWNHDSAGFGTIVRSHCSEKLFGDRRQLIPKSRRRKKNGSSPNSNYKWYCPRFRMSASFDRLMSGWQQMAAVR
jgi:hypothetical protein